RRRRCGLARRRGAGRARAEPADGRRAARRGHRPPDRGRQGLRRLRDRAGARMSTILVSGAGRGLGLELARQYAADGWRVIGTVRDAKVKLPSGVEPQIADVTERRQIAALAQALKGTPLDVLFCNAGIIGKRGMALGSFDYASWEEVLRVNLLGPAALVEALVENVAASERKLIAMMSSRLGSIAEASGMTLPYATSK